MDDIKSDGQGTSSREMAPPVLAGAGGDAMGSGRGGEGKEGPIRGVGEAIEGLLRQPGRVQWSLRQPGAGRMMGAMLLMAMGCALVYGVVIGSFAGGDQLWLAPLKVAGGLIFASMICLPSLYIFACLSGSRAGFWEVAGLVAGLLLLMTLLLIGFAPVAWLFSESTHSVRGMGLLHLLFWGVATLFGLRFLGAGFEASQAQSLAGVRVWAVIYVLVCLQLTTAMRPILGRASVVFPEEKKFFLKHWMECGDVLEPLPGEEALGGGER